MENLDKIYLSDFKLQHQVKIVFILSYLGAVWSLLALGIVHICLDLEVLSGELTYPSGLWCMVKMRRVGKVFEK